MIAILDVGVLIGLIVFNIVMLGSYRYDLRCLDYRIQEVEAQIRQLADHRVTPVVKYSPGEEWLRASAAVDNEISRARKRNRS